MSGISSTVLEVQTSPAQDGLPLEDPALPARISKLEAQLQESQSDLLQQSHQREILLERIAAFEEEQKLLQSQAESSQKHLEESRRLKAELYDLTVQNQSLLKASAEQKELLAAKEVLQSRVAELEEQYKESSGRVSPSQDAQPSSSEAYEALAQELDAARREAQDLKGEVDSLETAAKQSEKGQERLSSDLQQTVDQLDFATRRVTELELGKEENESQISHLQSAIEAAKAEIAQLNVQLKDLGQTSCAVPSLRENIASLEAAKSEFEALKEQRAQERNEQQALMKELDELTKANMALEEENDAHQSTVMALDRAQAELAAKTRQLERHQTELEDLKSLLDKSSSQVPDASNSSEHLKKIEELESKNTEWQAKIRKAKKAYDKVSGEKSEVQVRLKSLEDEIAELKATESQQIEDHRQYDALKAECEDLQQQVLALEAECSGLQQQIQEHKDHIFPLQAQYEAGQAEIECLNQAGADFQIQLAAVNQEKQSLEAQVLELGNLTESLRAELETSQESLADVKMLAETAIEERDQALTAQAQATSRQVSTLQESSGHF